MGARRGPAPVDLEAALRTARARRAALFAAPDTTAFRLVHGAGDGVPDLFVDHVDAWAVVHVRDAWHRRADEALDAVSALGFRGVYLKVHPRRASGRGSRMPEDLTPTSASRGEDAPTPLWAREHGLAYALDLGHGLSLGLFFDQRENRRRVREVADGRDALNLFAYTCGFGLAAAAGGAARTTNVDVSRRALDVGRGNYRAAGFEPSERHRFFREDALAFLERARRRGDRYGLVCVDPPTFATAKARRSAATKARRFTSGRDWVDLSAACLRVLEPGGLLLASSNDERLGPEAFLRLLGEAASEAAIAVRFDTAPVPLDYPPPPGRPPASKAFWATRRGAR